jgi:hypothetical protein
MEIKLDKLKQAFENLKDALKRCNSDVLNTLIHETYRGYSLHGTIETKKDVLDSFAPGRVEITDYSVTDETYEILGDAGIITGRGTIVGSFGEYTFNHDVLFTDIFVFENEQWFYYKSQVTEISREG